MFEYFFDYPEIPELGTEQTTEWAKMDGATLTTKQRDGGFGRDVSYGSEESSLEVWDGEYEPCEPYTDFLNVVRDRRTMGFARMREAIRMHGFEAVIQARVNYNGQSFSLGFVDVKTAEILPKLIRFKLVQDNKRALIKKNEETKIDLLSNKSLFGLDIDPMATTDVLLKAKPVFAKSKWSLESQVVQFAGGSRYVNYTAQSDIYGLRKSLVPFNQNTGIGDVITAYNNFKYLRAQNDIVGLTVTLDLDIDFVYRTVNGDGDSFARISLFWAVFDEPWSGLANASSYGDPFTYTASGPDPIDYHLPEQITWEVPFVGRDQVLAVFWELDWDITAAAASTTEISDFVAALEYFFVAIGNLPIGVLLDNDGSYSNNGPTKWVFNKADMTITGTSVGLDSVAPMGRWRDGLRQIAKSVAEIPTDMPMLDEGGYFYDFFFVDGNRIRQRLDVPFNADWKTLAGQLMLPCGDYQVNKDRVIADLWDGYYRLVDMGYYPQPANTESTRSFADTMTVVRFEPSFSQYEQDGGEENTIDGICTAAQYHNGNKGANDVKQVTLPMPMDTFSIGKMQEENIQKKPTTALAEDDKLYLLDCVQMPPGALGGFQKRLLQRSTNVQGVIEILNNDQEGDGDPLNWLTQRIGSQFTILQRENGNLEPNAGVYNVINIEAGVIRASRVDGGVVTTQNTIIKLSWTYSGVLYKNRTNEEVTITGLQTAVENYGNGGWGVASIAYWWRKLNATWMLWSKTGLLKKTFIKNEPDLIVQYRDLPPVDYQAGFTRAELGEPTISPYQITRKIINDLPSQYQLQDDMLEVRGFIRTEDQEGRLVKLFIDDSSYQIKSGIADVIGKELYEPEILTIDTFAPGVVRLSGVGYETAFISSPDYDVPGARIRFLDANSRPLTNYYRYDMVRVNGVGYSGMDALMVAVASAV